MANQILQFGRYGSILKYIISICRHSIIPIEAKPLAFHRLFFQKGTFSSQIYQRSFNVNDREAGTAAAVKYAPIQANRVKEATDGRDGGTLNKDHLNFLASIDI